MRVLIVTQYFWPENFRVNDLVSELAQRGYRVTVLTGLPNYPSGRIYDGYGWWRPSRERYAGTEVVRVPLLPRGPGGVISLLANYASFALLASVIGPLRLPRDFDAIFVHEPSPVTVGLPAIVMKWLTGAPILFWVLDLWPESISSAGAVRSPRVLSVVARLVRFIYRHCDRILIPSRGFTSSVLDHGVGPDRVRYFPNWAEPVFVPRPRSGAPPTPLPQGFRVMLAGNVGAAQDFPAILAAAERLKAESGIHWIILGEGRMLEWVRAEIVARGLQGSVHLLGQFSAELMPTFFAHADVMLVALRREPIFALTVPARLQAYLACGRPIVGMLDGEGARIIREANAGLTCPAGNAEALADTVLRLSHLDQAEREGLGANGLAYSRTEFERQFLFDRLEDWIREVVAARSARPV